jgi:hypothetical protein
MELLIERFDQSLALLLSLNHFSGAFGRLLLLVGAYVHLELGDLVGILAGSGHLDWTSPVKIKVTQRECQVLNVNAREVRVVLGPKELGWQNTALGSGGWRHEEIKLLVAVRVLSLH